jgi:hypothetical protein
MQEGAGAHSLLRPLDLNYSLVHAHRKNLDVFVSWRRADFSRFHAEMRAVTRTHDLVIFQPAAREISAIVRAKVFDRIEFAAKIEHSDASVSELDGAPLSVGQLTRLRNVKPFVRRHLANLRRGGKPPGGARSTNRYWSFS